MVDLLVGSHSISKNKLTRLLRVNQSKWLFALLLPFTTGMGTAQTLRINEIEIAPGGQVTLRHPADPAHYYILYRGADVLKILLPADIALGIPGFGQLTDRQPASVIGFYRAEQVPIGSPKDTDGDGIDDVWELQRPTRLNPLLASDALQPSAGPGSLPWKHVYESEKEAALATFASFVTTGSTHLASDGQAQVRVQFSRPYSGPLRFQVGGTALAGQDYEIPGLNLQTFTGQIAANGAEATIPILPKDQPPVNRDQTIVMTLLQPTNSISYRLATNGIVNYSLLLREADQGIFAGTITFTNGVILGAQAIKVALRSRPASASEAYVDALAAGFFRTNFSLTANLSSDGKSITFPESITRTTPTNTLGRPLTWTLHVDAASVSNNLVQAAVRLEVQGLTATQFTLNARGTLILTRLDAIQ